MNDAFEDSNRVLITIVDHMLGLLKSSLHYGIVTRLDKGVHL